MTAGIFKEWDRGSAKLSRDGRHRLFLSRFKPDALFKKKVLAVCGVNPSTADAKAWDATLRKCVGFAERLGYNELFIVNPFSWRATDPKDLLKAERAGHDVTGGADNLAYIIAAARDADMFLCAWGPNAYATEARRLHMAGIGQVLRAERGADIHCLGLCKGGEPSHPLMLPYTLKPKKYNPTGRIRAS